MDRFADDGKLGQGFTSVDDLVEVDIDNGVLGILNANIKNPQAHGYRCSFHPGLFQSIDFPQGT